MEYKSAYKAMENAEEQLKSIANYITDTNVNDGVANFLKELITKRGE